MSRQFNSTPQRQIVEGVDVPWSVLDSDAAKEFEALTIENGLLARCGSCGLKAPFDVAGPCEERDAAL